MGDFFTLTIADLASFAAETTGDISSEALDYAKRAIRLKYATLYDSHNWRESMRVLDGMLLDPTLRGVFFLPYDAEEVIFCSMSYDGINYIRLNYRERDWIERFTYPAFNLPGNTPWFYRAENLAWPYPNPGKFTFSTNNPSPFTLYIAGKDANNFPIAESFILQGITNTPNPPGTVSITTVNSYASVTVLSKDVTTANVTIQAQALAAPLVMPPGATELVFTQLVLQPPPIGTNPDGSPLSIYIRTQVKLKPDSLDNDYSVPRISHIWDALMSFTTGALWKRMGQINKFNNEEGIAMKHVQAAINVEKNQSEFSQQAVPVTYETGDYLRGWYQNRPTSWNPFGM
jgi:hypothetical protein